MVKQYLQYKQQPGSPLSHPTPHHLQRCNNTNSN